MGGTPTNTCLGKRLRLVTRSKTLCVCACVRAYVRMCVCVFVCVRWSAATRRKRDNLNGDNSYCGHNGERLSRNGERKKQVKAATTKMYAFTSWTIWFRNDYIAHAFIVCSGYYSVYYVFVYFNTSYTLVISPLTGSQLVGLICLTCAHFQMFPHMCAQFGSDCSSRFG